MSVTNGEWVFGGATVYYPEVNASPVDSDGSDDSEGGKKGGNWVWLVVLLVAGYLFSSAKKQTRQTYKRKARLTGRRIVNKFKKW